MFRLKSSLLLRNSCSVQVAMSATSEVTFCHMVETLKLGHLLPKLWECGWTNAALLAQAAGVNYANVKEKRFNQLVVCRVSDIDYRDFQTQPPSETFSIRLLFNQCVVIYTKLLKQFDDPEASAKQPMSSADRKARRNQLKQQFEYGGRDFTRKPRSLHRGRLPCYEPKGLGGLCPS